MQGRERRGPAKKKKHWVTIPYGRETDNVVPEILHRGGVGKKKETKGN